MKFSLGLAAALFLPYLVNARFPHRNSIKINVNVQVAPGGQLLYSPSNFAAKNGTTVKFYFPNGSTLHSVTQGFFERPCEYLAARGGGFDSGLQSGKEFTLEITDDKNPIFFFCKAPGHCHLGMVGAINAPATGKTYAAYLAAAKALGSNSTSMVSSSSTSMMSSSSTSSSSKSSSSTSSSSKSSSSTSSSSKSSSSKSSSSKSSSSTSSSSKPSSSNSSTFMAPKSSKSMASSSSMAPTTSNSAASNTSQFQAPTTSRSRAPDTSHLRESNLPTHRNPITRVPPEAMVRRNPENAVAT